MGRGLQPSSAAPIVEDGRPSAPVHAGATASPPLELNDQLPQTLDEQTVLSYARRVPVSLVKEGLLNGTRQEVIVQAAQWRDHGLRYLLVANVSIIAAQPSEGLGLQYAIFQDSARAKETVRQTN